MTSSIDSDKAWDDFVRERSFKKATSIQGQLDTITTMLSEIKTDTERAAAQAQAPGMMPPMDEGMGMGLPGDMPPMDGDMDMGTDGELEDAPAGTPVEGSEPPLAGGLDESMPPAEETTTMGPAEEFADTPVAPEEEEITEQTDVTAGTPVESDLVGQIKVMINSTEDNDQLKGLANLLSTALSQNRPPAPMQGAGMAEAKQTSTVLKSADDGKDDDKKDDEKEDGKDDDSEKKAEPEAEAEEEETVDTITVSDEPVPEEAEVAPAAPTIGEDVAAAVADVVEEIVDAALQQPDAVVEMAEEVAGEAPEEDISPDTESFEAADEVVEEEPEEPLMKSFADMFNERARFGIDGQPAIVKNKATMMARTRTAAALGNYFGDKEGEAGVEHLKDAKGALEDLTTNKEEAERDQNVEKEEDDGEVKKSAFDASGAPADAPPEDDKMPEDVPTDTQEQAEDEDIISAINAESIGKSALPSFADMMGGASALDSLRKADAGQPKDADTLRSEGDMPSGDVKVPKDADSSLEDGEMPCGDVSVPKDADSLRKTGIHIKSFAEMYAGDRNFTKTAGPTEATRPSTSAVGGTVMRTDINTVRKSAIEGKKPLRIGYGVDPHEAVADDWAEYRARFGSQ